MNVKTNSKLSVLCGNASAIGHPHRHRASPFPIYMYGAPLIAARRLPRTRTRPTSGWIISYNSIMRKLVCAEVYRIPNAEIEKL